MNDDTTDIRNATVLNEASPPESPPRAKAAKKKKRSKSNRKVAAKTATSVLLA